jgi:hypothetical protein
MEKCRKYTGVVAEGEGRHDLLPEERALSYACMEQMERISDARTTLRMSDSGTGKTK